MIHPTALVSPLARLGRDVSIGPYTIVHADVVLGDRSSVGSHCELGHPSDAAPGAPSTPMSPLVIGADTTIRSHSVFYRGSSFGDRLVTGHRVTVREGTQAGANLQIGTLGDIQGSCVIGDYVRFHSNVHIGKHSTIGNYVWIFPYVVLTNDPHPPSEVQMGVTVRDFAAIATMSIVLPGVEVGRGALVGAHSSVSRRVEPDTVVAGAPAKFVCRTDEIKLKDGSGRPAYPWRRHFTRGYPEEAVQRWLAEFSQADASELAKDIAESVAEGVA